MRKSEFLLAGKEYEVVDSIVERLGKSLVGDEEGYIASKAKFFDEYVEIKVFYEYCVDGYEYEVSSEVYKVKYEDLEF